MRTRLSPAALLTVGALPLIALALYMTALAPNSKAQAATTCTQPLGNTTSVADAYKNWKDMYVTATGAGGDLRVQRSAFDGYDTVSEGIAYGMLFAVYNNDKATFDGLWSYAQKHTNGNGVMNWRIAADGTTTGYNGATDADEDMAAALIAADTTWGGYRTAATRQIDIIKRFEIEAGSLVLKPGDVWGGSDLLNPSYIAPAYYDIFSSYRGDNTWLAIKASNYRVLQAAQNQTTGLLPDWSTASGAAASGMSHDYGYDASRAPLRLAMSAAWTCDQPAVNALQPFNVWSAQQGANGQGDRYSITGTALGTGNGVPLLAAAASGALTSTDSVHRSAVWSALTTAPSNSYYPDSMRLFGLMIASGVLADPLSLPQRQPVAATIPAATPTSFAINGTGQTVNVGDDTEYRLTFTAPQRRTDLLIDLELYDAGGQRVAQQVYEHQTLSSDATGYTLRWKASAAGAYTLKAGIFTAGWAQNLSWNDRAATVIVNPLLTTTPVTTPILTTVAPPAPTAPATTTPSATVPVVTTPTITPQAPASADLSIWWPAGSQAVSGVQPFKAVINGVNQSDYDMFWQVDGGQLNRMDMVNDAAPHKESRVDLQYWTWAADNRYSINFVAKRSDGTIIAQKSVRITISR